MSFPKVLHLTCKDKNNITNDVWIKCLNEYKKIYIDYEIKLYDNEDIYKIIKNLYPEYLEDIKKITTGAILSDIFRYLILYLEGGIYSDLDCFPLKHPNYIFNKIDNETNEKLVKSNINIILGKETRKGSLCQWYMISKQKEKIFLDSFLKCMKNIKILQNVDKYKNNPIEYEKIVLSNSGPTMFNNIINNNDKNILKLPMEYFCVGSIIKGKRKQKKTRNSIIRHLFDGSWR